MIVYLISYYNTLTYCRDYYLNRSCFDTLESAEREVMLLKKDQLKRNPKTRTRFKIHQRIIKHPLNIPIK